VILTEFATLDNRELHDNQLTTLDAGVFGKNRELMRLYVDRAKRTRGERIRMRVVVERSRM
jgi:hypothetical protein